MPNPLVAREERHLIPRLPELAGKNVLDVACGTGRWLTELLAHGARSGVGIDISDAMLRAARSKERIYGRLIQADCMHLPFPAATLDFAVCSFATSHIADIDHLFCEIARVLRPESRFIVSDLHPTAYAIGWRTGFRDEFGPVQIEAQPYSIDVLENACSANGFERLAYTQLCIEAAEKPIFLAAGKPELFNEVVGMPAIFVLELKRSASSS